MSVTSGLLEAPGSSTAAGEPPPCPPTVADGTDPACASPPVAPGTPDTPPQGRNRALDGLRGAAWLAVFAYHAQLWPDLQLGETAMYVFLSLSGFVITLQLAGEAGRAGVVRIGRFFRRRGRRLVPALAALLVVWLAVVVAVPYAGWLGSTPGSVHGSGVDPLVALKGVLGALVEASNWLDILGLYGGRFPLGHLWFLATQEQLYLLWVPLLAVLLVKARRWAAPVALVLASASVLEALAMMQRHTNWMRIYAGTDTRAASILLGSALALGWSSGRLRRLSGRWVGGLVRVGALAALGWTVVGFTHQHASFGDGLAWVVATLAGAALVVGVIAARTGPLARGLAHPLLGYLGSRSYGLYLWHYVWLTWLAGLGGVGIVAAFVASLATAELSWQVVERRWGARTRVAGGTPSTQGQQPDQAGSHRQPRPELDPAGR